MPYNALGSSIISESIKRNIKIYAIKENNTVINISKEVIKEKDTIETVNSYNECYKILKEKLNDKK